MSFDDLTDEEQLAVKEKALRAATQDWDARIDIDEEACGVEGSATRRTR
ncbi:MAG: hypothetical protein RIF41_03865 [Polyangiaceae bacterium]